VFEVEDFTGRAWALTVLSFADEQLEVSVFTGRAWALTMLSFADEQLEVGVCLVKPKLQSKECGAFLNVNRVINTMFLAPSFLTRIT
jgi:hypothetical protein